MEKPNIIFISADSLRWDYFKRFFKNNFFKNSIIFENCFSPGPSTIFSFPSIIRGDYPFEDKKFPLLKTRKNLFKILKDKGYYTFFIHSNPYLTEYFNFNYGVEDFVYLKKEKTSSLDPQSHKAKLISKTISKFGLLKKIKNFVKKQFPDFYKIILELFEKTTLDVFCSAQEINRVIEKKLFKLKVKQPFFLWIHYMDTHHPYNNLNLADKIYDYLRFEKPFKDKNFVKDLKNSYIKAIKYLNNQISYILENLKNKGLLDNTILVFFSDHGEAFFEHKTFFHSPKIVHHHLYNENIKVPCVIKIPSRLEKNLIIKKNFSLVFLKKIILNSKKINIINKKDVFAFTFRSYDGILENVDKKSFAFAYIKKNKKLIYDNFSKKIEVYDLKKDSKEENNLYPNLSLKKKKQIKKIIKNITNNFVWKKE